MLQTTENQSVASWGETTRREGGGGSSRAVRQGTGGREARQAGGRGPQERGAAAAGASPPSCTATHWQRLRRPSAHQQQQEGGGHASAQGGPRGAAEDAAPKQCLCTPANCAGVTKGRRRAPELRWDCCLQSPRPHCGRRTKPHRPPPLLARPGACFMLAASMAAPDSSPGGPAATGFIRTCRFRIRVPNETLQNTNTLHSGQQAQAHRRLPLRRRPGGTSGVAAAAAAGQALAPPGL